MSEKYETTKQSQEKHVAPRVYNAPRITEFGPVGTLTQAGSGLGQEGGAMMGMNMMMA